MKRKNHPGKKQQSTWEVLGTEIDSRIEWFVLACVFLYLSIDLFQQSTVRIEIFRLQFFYLNLINILVSSFIVWRADQFLIPFPRFFRKNFVAIAYFIFVLVVGFSFFAAYNKTLAIVSFLQILVVCTMIVNLTILLYNRLHLVYKIGLLFGFVGFFQATSVLINLKSLSDPALIKQFLTNYYLQGNAGNMNILSAGVMIKLPFVMVAITHYSGLRQFFLSIAAFCMLLCMFLINARATLITIPVFLTIYTVYFFRIKRAFNFGWKRILHVILPFVLAFMLANMILGNSEADGGRQQSTAARLEQIDLEDSSIAVRIWYWQNALDIIRQHPVLGIGTGNWLIEHIPVGKNNYIISKNAHNDFLEITAEIGVFGGLVYLLLFLALLLLNLRRVLFPVNGSKQTIAYLVLMMLAIYGIDALINFPLQRPTMQLGFAFIMVLTLLNGGAKSQIPARQPAFRKDGLAVFWVLLAAAPVYVSYHADRTAKLDRILVMVDNIDRSSSGVMTGDKVANWQPKFPNVSWQNSNSYDEYAGIYYLREKRYEDAIRYLDKGRAINPYLGRPDFYKMIMARERGLGGDSVYTYLKSSYSYIPYAADRYRDVIAMVGARKDTSEIFELYSLYTNSYRFPVTSALTATVNALKTAGYPHERLVAFAQQEKVNFPADSAFDATVNSMQISQYLVEGQAYFSKKDYEASLASYYKALEIDSTNVFAFQNIGFYYYNLGRYREGIPFILKSLEKPGLSGGASEYFLGVSYVMINDLQQACKYLKIAEEKKHPWAASYRKQVCR